MNIPVEVSFRDMAPSSAIEDYVRSKAERLERYCDRIMRCRVTLEAPHRHSQHGSRYQVRIELGVPGDELVVGGRPDALANEDLYASVDAAIDDAQRVLQDYARRRRLDVKHHEQSKRGRVVKLFSYEGYGFLETQEGEEIYFHRNSVLHGAFDRLKIGAKVRYEVEDGFKGPQASTVEWTRHH